jgi:beta-phosphoglucomutase
VAEARPGYEGAIFDVDGVLVDSPHERAWRETLDELMAGEWAPVRATSRYASGAFTTAVYQAHVAGRPRLDGARAALEYFGVPDAERRAVRYAEQKQRRLVALIEAGAFVAYDDGVRFLLALKALGLRLAVASSSKNANTFLRAIPVNGQTLVDVFDVNLCGRDFAHGKPDPEIFATAGRELGLPPDRNVVVEDAPAGVQAAKRAGMAALGVARVGDGPALQAAGADLVVATLDAVDVPALRQGRLRRLDEPAR